MFTFLLVVQALVAALLVGVILMQQSEGGGLGMGGSPSGLMSARGAANFLTRATTILAIVFVSLSIALAVIAAQRTGGGTIDTSLAKQPLPAAPVTPPPAVPMSGTGAPTTGTAPATGVTPQPVVPMAAPAPRQTQPRVQQQTAPRPATTSRPVTTTPPPVTTTVTPSIPRAVEPAPRTATPAGPPANSN
jgi:preprotein translocase subunit SecG